MIADLKRRRSTFSKRRKTIFTKASKISKLTGAHATVIIRSSTGRTYYGSYPSGKEILPKNTRPKGKVISPKALSEWEEDWVKQECDSCTTKKDYESLIAKYEACAVQARKRLEDWESKPSAEARDSKVVVDCDSEILRLKASIGELLTVCQDFVGHGDCNSFQHLPVNSAAGGAFQPTSSDSAIGGPSNPTCPGLDASELHPDDFLNPSEDGDHPENSAIGGAFNHDDFAELEDLVVLPDINNI